MSLGLAGAIVAARAVLAVVFALAGIAKLGDRAGTAQMLGAFGLPRGAAAAFAPVLPLAELAVAVALVPTVSGRWGALAALVLLAAFTAAIAVNLMLGRKPECRCFGQVASAPIGAATVARNRTRWTNRTVHVYRRRCRDGSCPVACGGDALSQSNRHRTQSHAGGNCA